LRESDIAKVGKTKKLTNGNDENKCKERRRKESFEQLGKDLIKGKREANRKSTFPTAP
jgi:hypothetical protein